MPRRFGGCSQLQVVVQTLASRLVPLGSRPVHYVRLLAPAPDGSISHVSSCTIDAGRLVFEDHSDFRPNLTPKQVIRAGSFGG